MKFLIYSLTEQRRFQDQKYQIKNGECTFFGYQYLIGGQKNEKNQQNQQFTKDTFSTQTKVEDKNSQESYHFHLLSNEQDQKQKNIENVVQTQSMEDEEKAVEIKIKIEQPKTQMTQARFMEIFNEQFLSEENLSETINYLTPSTDRRQRNETKNICKGALKALAHWLLDKKSRQFLLRYCRKYELDLDQYQREFAIKIRRLSSISIEKLREFLTVNQYAQHNRILFNYFLRKKFIIHIFNSKMQKIHIHLKYIPRWLEIIKNPYEFKNIKLKC